MAKKYYYYVLVFTNSGPMYVTSIDRNSNYAHWDIDKEPIELGSSYAEDLAMGLNLNSNHSVVIKSTRKIDSQPYRYSDFDCKFIKRT